MKPGHGPPSVVKTLFRLIFGAFFAFDVHTRHRGGCFRPGLALEATLNLERSK
jgi:hypothetical protein